MLARARPLALAAVLAAAPAGAQQVVTFDDIAPEDLRATATLIRDGGVYGGIRWDANSLWSTGTFAGTIYRDVLRCHSDPYCSSPNGAAADGSSFGAFSFLSTSRFVGLWISGPAYTDAVPFDAVGTVRTRVAAELWRGGSLVYTTPFLDVTPEPQFLRGGFAGGVDAVRLIGDPAYTVVDDITFSATPEPATQSLAAGGLLLLAAARRRMVTRG